MTTASLPHGAVSERAGLPRWWPAAAVIAALVVADLVLGSTEAFPASWDIGLAEPINRFQAWVGVNRGTNVVIHDIFGSIGDATKWLYGKLLEGLLGMPWFVLPVLGALLVARSGRWASAAAAGAGLLYNEVFGLRELAMQTLALSLLAVMLCVAIGGPLGVWLGTRPHMDRYVNPVIDALQTLPTTLYLVPAALLFSIGQTPAILATVAFAVGPLVRVTSLGIREVPAASVEAGTMFGSSPSQLLWKVRLPQARTAALTGLNQTIMAALSMVVLASLVGAGGLGAAVFETLRLRSPGRGLLVGLGIVALAIALDRVCRALAEPARLPLTQGRRFWWAVATGTVAAVVVGRVAGATTAPWTIDRNLAEPVDRFVTWVRDTYGEPLQTFNDVVIADITIPIRDFLGSGVAWPVVIAGVAALSWWLRGPGLAVFAVIGLSAIGLFGMWGASAETLAQLLLAVLVAMLVAVPLGILVGTRPRVESVVNPLMETLQTLPSVIYAIPFVMIFAAGYLPGMLATVLYAVPAGVRLVAMSVRGVDPQVLEASTTFGASSWQRLVGVRVPMAFDGIMLGVNQVVMMSMSMVVITGTFGSQGLGYQLVSALTKPDTGVGVEAGLSVLVMGILLDRLSQGVGQRFSPLRPRR